MVTNMENISVGKIRQNSIQAWVICMAASLYSFYMFFQTAKVNAIASGLMADFKITASGLGLLSSMYFWGNISFLFPAGLLLDRFSAKKLLLMAISIDVLCTTIFSFTNNFVIASMCFIFTGAAGAFTLLLPLRLISRWFSSDKMAFISGLIVTVGFIGDMVSQAPLALLVNTAGWREAMQWNAAFGGLLFILAMFIIQDFPKSKNEKIESHQAIGVNHLWNNIKTSLCNRQNWLFGLYTNLINLPILVFGEAFGVRYVSQICGITESKASFASLFLFLGAMIGAPIFGRITDKIRLRKPLMYFGGIISLALILATMFVAFNYYVICALFFSIGFFTSGQVITYPVIMESNPIENTGVSLGMGSILIMSGGAIFVPLFGWLLDLCWDGKMVNNIPWHSVSDYHIALWMLPITTLIGLVCIIFGKETKCRRIS